MLLGLLLVLEGEDREMYKGWERKEGSDGNLKEMSESASTTHFMLGLN